MTTNFNKKYQSISNVKKSPKKNPIKQFKQTITNEVPMASLIGNLAMSIKAGTIKNPPPAPIKPIKTPKKNPSLNIKGLNSNDFLSISDKFILDLCNIV